jgi:acyl-CoA reductase-like NAD-dependent aldehyde dehydrogenase
MSTADTMDVRKTAALKVAAVRQAASVWAQLAPEERARRLREAGQALLVHADELAALVCEETHKPLAESYSAEVLGVADLFAYWCKKGPKLLEPRKGDVPKLEMPGKKAWIERLPRGVIGIISPWNFPVALPMRTIVPALLAGNGVVLKPSEVTPRTGAWLVGKLRESLGGILDVLEGDGSAGAALVEAGPDMIVFTGSTRTGRKVAVACAERGIACELELGGKDCAVVLADADVERTAAGIAWGILTNAGQNCAGIERVAVHADLVEQFVPALKRWLERASGEVAELVTPTQRQIVQAHVQDALDRGAELVTGGLGEPGKPIPPTLLRNAPRDCQAWTEESFGPTAVLVTAKDDDGLVEAANDSRYGLGASVWGRDLTHAESVARRLRSGMVWVNNHSFSGALPDLPWVGMGGDSGSGVTNSPEALMHLTRPRLLLVDSNKGLEPWWFPYGSTMVELMRILVDRQRSGGLGATLRTIKALRKRNREMRTPAGRPDHG